MNFCFWRRKAMPSKQQISHSTIFYGIRCAACGSGQRLSIMGIAKEGYSIGALVICEDCYYKGNAKVHLTVSTKEENDA